MSHKIGHGKAVVDLPETLPKFRTACNKIASRRAADDSFAGGALFLVRTCKIWGDGKTLTLATPILIPKNRAPFNSSVHCLLLLIPANLDCQVDNPRPDILECADKY